MTRLETYLKKGLLEKKSERMRTLLVIIILITGSLQAKVYELKDLKLEKPQGRNLSEQIVYTHIYGGETNKLLKQLKKQYQENKIDNLLRNQLLNLLSDNKQIDQASSPNAQLRKVKEILLNKYNKDNLKNLLKDSENDQYIYDLIISETFKTKSSLFSDYILKLKPSKNLQILLLKINYEKANTSYLEASLKKLKGKNKLIIYDLLIKEYLVKNNTAKAIDLIVKRDEEEYEITYSEQLINYYEKLDDKNKLRAEISKVLARRKDFDLVIKLIKLEDSKLDQDDFERYLKSVNSEKSQNLKLIMIETLYSKNKPWDKLVKNLQLSGENKSAEVFFKAVDLIVNNKEKEALQYIQKQEFEKDLRLRKLTGKLSILTGTEIKDKNEPYYSLQKEINERIFIEQDYKADYPLKKELLEENYKLIDFYRAYEAIDTNDKNSMIKCFIIYNKLVDKLDKDQVDLMKQKMAALNYE